METIQKYIELARLICKRRLWGLNGREAEQLEAWLKENPRDKSAFKNLQHIDPEGLADRYEKIDIDRQWKNFQKRTAWRTYIWWRVGVVAAGICLLLGTGWLFYRQARLFPQPEIAATVPEAVRLVRSSGRILDLSDCENVDVREIEGKVILHNGQLEYCSDSVKRNSEETNTLIIPKGAFYHLIFSDGTKVWLNSDSKITYPLVFSGNARKVILTGEAYFEVTKNSGQPFIVQTENFNVKVLGTSFCINTFGDNGKVYTALESGVVEMDCGRENTLILAPGQVAELDVRRPGACVRMSEVSVEQLVAWKKGLFCFRQTSLPDILKQVARYYDVHFMNLEDAEGEAYTGDISRNVSLEVLLGAISAQTTDIQFKIVNRTVYITKKRD